MSAKGKEATPIETRTARLTRLFREKFEAEQAYNTARQHVADLRAQLSKLAVVISATMAELEELEGRAGGVRRRKPSLAESTSEPTSENSQALDQDAPVAELVGGDADEETGFSDDMTSLAVETPSGDGSITPTLRARVLGVLRASGQPMTVQQVAGALNDGTSERSAFFTLQSIRSRNKTLIKPGRGLWQLMEEEP